MKKIPTLFERIYSGNRVVGISENVISGMEWVLAWEGIATIKVDGSCCCVIGEELYKRYDAKRGKVPPSGSIPCCDPDPVTGHWPHWVKVDANNPAEKWLVEAFNNYQEQLQEESIEIAVPDGTYEAIGPHFQGNPYKLNKDTLDPHGVHTIYVERTFQGIKKYLAENEAEGIVFWKDNQPMCKIKRTDFGFPWPSKRQ